MTGTTETTAAYAAATQECALIEGADRGQLLLVGDDAAEFLQGQVTNDIVALTPGRGCYAALLDHKGKMRCDLRVFAADGGLLVDCAADRLALLKRTIETFKIGFRFTVEDVGERLVVLRLIGPESRARIGSLADLSAVGSDEHDNASIEITGVALTAAATDLGIDLFVPRDAVEVVTRALLEAEIATADQAVAEILRVETGRPRYGFELGEDTIPEEAGLNDRAVNFEKGCYVGQETVARLHYKGKPNRHLRGLKLAGEVAAGDEVSNDERVLGSIGTVVESPRFGWIALAILRREAGPGDSVVVGAASVPAEVVDAGNY